MRRIIIFLLFVFICTGAWAGKKYNSNTGTNDYCVTIETEDQSVQNKSCETLVVQNGFLAEDGDTFIIRSGFGGTSATSMTTDATSVPTSYVFIRKAIASSSDPGDFSGGTLDNGVSGQLITVFITEGDGTAVFDITPTTKTGFTKIRFYGPDDFATFLYLDDIAGWIIIAESGTTIIY